ncbi:MAG TPA: chromosomal replication initiator protein DnaA [Tepidisphaeraceae bacterium]|nr:chromosomal replication initiator protein DnaA [Tepidisphaeraceae bacterium]
MTQANFLGGDATRSNSNRIAPPAPLDPNAWSRILARVRAQHPTLNRHWFDDLSARQLSPMVIQVTVPTMAQLSHCQTQLQQPFTHAAIEVLQRIVTVSFHSENMPRGGVFSESDTPLPLNPDYTFDEFVTGPCNRLAHAASVAVGEQPGRTYNPLFIHGGVGLGKTHLLQAICTTVITRNPGTRILYLSCDNFVNQFINSVSNNTMNDFRNRYRNVDMLVIDDIHFLAGHDRTQEEFFHTFNTLYQQHKQIVLSCDCSPSEIPELEERLVSRFKWGLVARIEKPCYETRVAILRKKMRMRGIDLSDDVITYAAARIDSNTRELEGAITKFLGLAMLNGNKIDLEIAKQALGEAEQSKERHITIQQIIDVVTKYYNIKLSDLQSKKRNQSIAFPRQICMFLSRRHTRYSLEEIGGYFGGRDHTTVLHGVRQIDRSMKVDRDVAQQVNHLDSLLSA